jgi:hypothetical protein
MRLENNSMKRNYLLSAGDFREINNKFFFFGSF